MPLETRIAELNENIKALIEVLSAKGVNPVHTPAAKTETLEAKIENVVAKKGQTAAKEEVKALIAEAQEAKAELVKEAVKQTPEEFYAKVLRPAAQALIVKHGNHALASLLKNYDVATLPKLPAEAYRDILGEINAAIEGSGSMLA
jgi:hypothetical protein